MDHKQMTHAFKLPSTITASIDMKKTFCQDKTVVLACSQPPLLSSMVAAVHEATADEAFLEAAFAALENEHAYWTSTPRAVTLAGGPAAAHSLSRYWADTFEPRPESFR
jgi:neutral trehalase